MTVLQRAAAIAVMTLSLTGLLGTSSRSLASELATTGSSPRQAISFYEINAQDRISVPTAAPIVSGDALASAADEDFDSLADAVAAHSDTKADDAVRCLAGAIYFESQGEPLAGQLAVAEVILNRAKSGRFPSNVCDVITQRGQFSFVRGGQIPAIDAGRAAYRTALAVAQVALAEAWDSPAADALYFNTASRRPAARVTRIAAVGNHIFYR